MNNFIKSLKDNNPFKKKEKPKTFKTLIATPSKFEIFNTN